MADIPRLNGIIKQLEAGKTAITTFSPAEIGNGVSLATSGYDGVIFEMEHNPFETQVTPIVRIPPNGSEMNQFLAKQVLDVGVYGVVWPHVSTVEEAYNAVSASRYPRPLDRPYLEPRGQRGDAPVAAARYWGIGGQEYYKRADVWPLNPEGEILVIIMCEEVKAIGNLDEMLKKVPGIGVVLIGEGDLSQDLGHPREYDHPVVVEAMAEIRRICAANNVICGHPHADMDNIDTLIEQGYRFLVAASSTTTPTLNRAKELTGR
jgi:4-hydroxy-2-oxoheptanedioate aldolase